MLVLLSDKKEGFENNYLLGAIMTEDKTPGSQIIHLYKDRRDPITRKWTHMGRKRDAFGRLSNQGNQLLSKVRGKGRG